MAKKTEMTAAEKASEETADQTKVNLEYNIQAATYKTATYRPTEVETACQQETGQAGRQDRTAADSDKEPQSACDSAGGEAPVQPDGGWGWVVCLTTMLNYGTVTGLINGLPLVYAIVLKEFSKEDTSIAFKTCKVFFLLLLRTE